MKKRVVILGGTKGIGKSIEKKIKTLKNHHVTSYGTKQLDTSNLDDVKKFIKKSNLIDILILNTGGPPAKDFFDIKEKEFFKYHIQLFYSFILILQKVKIKKNGYIFLISSTILKEPPLNMILSSTYRTAFLSFFKVYSKIVSKNNISCITISPGSIKTNRIKNLVKNIKKYEEQLPSKKLGDPDEIGEFVKFVIEKRIRYLKGSNITFDGSTSNFIF